MERSEANVGVRKEHGEPTQGPSAYELTRSHNDGTGRVMERSYGMESKHVILMS